MEIKRILTFLDEVRSEAGATTEPPLRKVGRRGDRRKIRSPAHIVEDLSPLTKASEAIGREICAIAVALAGARTSR